MQMFTVIPELHSFVYQAIPPVAGFGQVRLFYEQRGRKETSACVSFMCVVHFIKGGRVLKWCGDELGGKRTRVHVHKNVCRCHHHWSNKTEFLASHVQLNSQVGFTWPKLWSFQVRSQCRTFPRKTKQTRWSWMLGSNHWEVWMFSGWRSDDVCWSPPPPFSQPAMTQNNTYILQNQRIRHAIIMSSCPLWYPGCSRGGGCLRTKIVFPHCVRTKSGMHLIACILSAPVCNSVLCLCLGTLF